MASRALTGQQLSAAGLDGWTLLLSFGQGGLETRIHTGNFCQGLRIVESIGRAAEELDHHAELDLRRFQVDVRLSSRDSGGVTETDVALARRIDAIVAELIDYLDLSSVADLPMAGLPFGTLKRAEMARALAVGPKLLLLDEPAGGLNHDEIGELGRLIRRIRDERRVAGRLDGEGDVRLGRARRSRRAVAGGRASLRRLP